MSKFYIKAQLQSMSKEEMFNMIPPDTLKRLKAGDENPMIKVFAVGHEGDADGRLIGIGRKIIQYFRDAILQLSNKIKMGLQIFHDHAVDNLHTGREQIGEVVGKALQNIGGKLFSLAAVYIYPQYRNLPLDIASIEANITYQEKNEGKAEALSVDEVTGIALGNSKVSKPGFPGATLLGTVQAFTQKKKGRVQDMTIQEIISAIKEGKFKITDVFSEEEIKESDPSKKAKQTEYEHAKRIEKSLGEEREKVLDLHKEVDELKGKNKNLNESANSSKVSSLFEEAVKERKLNEKQKNFISRNLKTFKSGEDKEKVKEDFDRFLDAQIKEFDDTKKIIMGQEDADDTKNKGVGSGDGKELESQEEYEEPEKNDFIPGSGEKKKEE